MLSIPNWPVVYTLVETTQVFTSPTILSPVVTFRSLSCLCLGCFPGGLSPTCCTKLEHNLFGNLQAQLWRPWNNDLSG